eukprot:13411967-Ditylum_brightwellii.AAC.1
MGEIKYIKVVHDRIQEKKIFLDHFYCNEVELPGFLINLHPKITRKDDLKEQLKKDMAQTKFKNKDKIVQDWIK